MEMEAGSDSATPASFSQVVIILWSQRVSNSERYQRLTGMCSILLAAIVLGSIITLFASVNSDANAFGNSAHLLSVGPIGATMLILARALWSWIELLRRPSSIVGWRMAQSAILVAGSCPGLLLLAPV